MLVDGFEWRSDKFIFNEELMQDYDEDSDKGYIHKIDVFQGATRVIQRSIALTEKENYGCKKLVCNLYKTRTM